MRLVIDQHQSIAQVARQPFRQRGLSVFGIRSSKGTRAAPKLERRHQLEAEVRRQWSGKIAAGLYVTRDLELDSWGVGMPVYFIRDPAGGLAGGVVASYRSDEKRFDVSLFLGEWVKIHK